MECGWRSSGPARTEQSLQQVSSQTYLGHTVCRFIESVILFLVAFSGVPKNFLGVGGVQQVQLKTEDKQNRDLGVVKP